MEKNLMRLLKPFQGTKQQKQRLVDFVKENSGDEDSSSLNNFSVVFIDTSYYDEQDNRTIKFELVTKASVKDNIIFYNLDSKPIEVSWSSGKTVIKIYEVSSYSGTVITQLSISDLNYSSFISLLNDFGKFTTPFNEATYEAIPVIRFNHLNSSTKRITDMAASLIDSAVLIYLDTNTNTTYYGRIITDDKTNKYLYVSMGSEIWKYSYTFNPINQNYSQITFIEVVTP